MPKAGDAVALTVGARFGAGVGGVGVGGVGVVGVEPP